MVSSRLMTNSESNPPFRLRVSQKAESILRSGHPWLFSDSIREQNRAGQAGDLAVIYDRKDQFLGMGLFDPEGPSASACCMSASRKRWMAPGGSST